ncbi:MAG: hypothetical protein HXY18_00125, partial [Bryobacteraceae bacterium]|nr:hypothetical protein [Bryobacteraceae bacterium]
PKYDTNEDSIVRVSAAEVRKRLARYYHESGIRGAVEMSIPLGSYRVEIHPSGLAARVAPPPAPPSLKHRQIWVIAAGAAFVLFLLILAVFLSRRETATGRFWGAAVKDPAAVVILAPHPVVYTFTRETFQRFRGDSATHAQRQMEALSGPPEASISLKEVVPIRDQYLGLGSAHAISSVAAMLAVRKKSYNIRFGKDFSFQDIRHAPAVLVGAYANRWTLQLTEDLRFVLADRDGAPEIKDRQTGKEWRLNSLRADGWTPEDYVIVSRLFHPQTGRLIVALAGITQYGTQAAGEFVTDEALLQAGTAKAPEGWERKNVQFLLSVRVVEGVPGRPQVVAAHYW